MALKLGKKPAVDDPRTLRLSEVIELPMVPSAWDFDRAHPSRMKNPMYGNDVYGDCVIAGRAHQTRRFEFFEQKGIIPITTGDVTHEYLKETGGEDCGLVVLDSLKTWRRYGWAAAGKTYNIYAFGSVGINQTDTKNAIYLLNGIGIGLDLPLSAEHQFNVGNLWGVTTGDDAEKGSWGGHYVYCVGYNSVGPVCVTWGQRQQMTWAFYKLYCDEAWGIVDNRDRFVNDSPVDVAKLDSYLSRVA